MATIDLFRISTLARVVEDGVVAGVKSIGRGASSAGQSIKRGAHTVSLEYRARMVAKAAEYAVRQADAISAMSQGELDALQRDMAEINARAIEIIEARESRRASRTGN